MRLSHAWRVKDLKPVLQFLVVRTTSNPFFVAPFSRRAVLPYNGRHESVDAPGRTVRGCRAPRCACGRTTSAVGKERANSVGSKKNGFRRPHHACGSGCKRQVDTGSNDCVFEWRSRDDGFHGKRAFCGSVKPRDSVCDDPGPAGPGANGCHFASCEFGRPNRVESAALCVAERSFRTARPRILR